MILLGNILATLVITIGVATGNVSSNNTKYGNALIANESKETERTKPIQKVAYNQTYTYTQVNNYTDTTGDNNGLIFHEHYKYYLDNNLNANTDLGNIYNSTYIENIYYNSANGTGYPNSIIFAIFDITPYLTSYNTNITFEYSSYYTSTNQPSNNAYISTEVFTTTDNYFTRYIDLTTYDVSELAIQLYTDRNTHELNTIKNESDFINIPVNTQTAVNTTINLNDVSDRIIVILTRSLTCRNSPSGDKIVQTPKDLIINGNHQEINYEVIDLPGLMFEILTMPFSFISTAFNLTVFPGTPYAFNFGNVFLTIIAAFILMWILKKVF